MGHQPGKVDFGNGIVRPAGQPFSYAGLLFLMDVGASRGVQDSPGIVLKIQHLPRPSVSTLDDTGHEHPLWTP